MTGEPSDPRSLDQEIIRADEPEIAAEYSDAERLDRIRDEFDRGFKILAGLGPAVCIFGSARTPQDHPEYRLAEATGAAIGEAGFAVITGGGPGTMEAANRGAKTAGTASVGLNIDLPDEQALNDFVDLGMEFHYFFVRKLMFVRYSWSFVVFPGGYGTMDEFFEALTLIQTDRARPHPVVLVGSDYWSGLVEWIERELLAAGRISPDDMDLFRVVDAPGEIVEAATGDLPVPRGPDR